MVKNINNKYLSSPYLKKLRKASKETFCEFMKNERESKKFIKYIDNVKRKREQQAELFL